ncbi:MAG: hypothetical protein ABR529_10340 [Actinomycetota bacterium]
MDITVYLPDDIGKRAKEAGLPFSQLLRGAVHAELERRERVAETLSDIESYEVPIQTPEGSMVIGRITGKFIAEATRSGVDVYLTSDRRVLIYDQRREQVEDVTHNPAAAFEWFKDRDVDAYISAMEAIGESPVIDL